MAHDKVSITVTTLICSLLVVVAAAYAQDDKSSDCGPTVGVDCQKPTPKKKAKKQQQPPKKKAKTQQQQRPRIDVVFAVDTTSSMGDEIEVIKEEIWNIANGLMAGKPTPDIRFGLVFFRDKGDAYVVKQTELTREVDAIHKKLMSAKARGGGDLREHVAKGLQTAVDLNWDMDKDTSRLIYLVGDAPAQTRYNDGFTIEKAVAEAQQKSITIHTIGCSGIEADDGRKQFASIASKSAGTFKPLTYHAVVKDDDGKKKSVVYYEGDYYEAEEEISDKEWKRGAGDLVKSGKVKKAERKNARRAAHSKSKKNNLDSVVEDSVKNKAMEMGVAY